MCVEARRPYPGSLAEWAEKKRNEGLKRIKEKYEADEGKVEGATQAAPEDPRSEYDSLWIRDNGIVAKEVSEDDCIMNSYIEFSKSNHRERTLTGPGEPKFNADGSAFNEPWGRPQNDGPAYRALRWMEWIQRKLKQGKLSEAKASYRPDLGELSVKWDLEYLAHHWADMSFDLWEEQKAMHTHTVVMIRRALQKALEIAEKFEPGGKTSGAYLYYKQQIGEIDNVMRAEAWDSEKNHLKAVIREAPAGQDRGWVTKPENLDISIILSLLHSFDPSAPSLSVFAFSNEKVLATMAELESGFGKIFRINEKYRDARFRGAVALGRYLNDTFHGGNPWVIATQAGAEYYYRVGADFLRSSTIKITSVNQKFFARLFNLPLTSPLITVGKVFRKSDKAYASVIYATLEKGDAYLEIIRSVTPENGRITEQFGRGFRPGDTGDWVRAYLEQTGGDGNRVRTGGELIGAIDLTWNDAALASALRAKREFIRLIKQLIVR